jgi:hypothetical protein
MNQKLFTIAFALWVAGPVAIAGEPTRIYLANDDHATSLVSAQRVTHIETSLELLTLKNGLLETTVPARRIESYTLIPGR